MRQLFIVRHAQAEAGEAAQTDFERALTTQGRTEALLLGQFILCEKFLPQRILVSPAKRARDTFAQINAALKLPYEEQAEIYNAEFGRLLELIKETKEDIQSVMIVGHNPGMHALAAYLSHSGGKLDEFPPASLCVLDFKGGWKSLCRHSGEQLVFRKA